MTATIVATSMPERLKAAAAAVADTRTAHSLAVDQRDELVREAIDSGELSQRAVAKLLGFAGVAGVCRILAKPGPNWADIPDGAGRE